MRLRIRHATTYRYGDPVATSHHEAHLTPRSGPHSTVLDTQISIAPTPIFRRDRYDYFGNAMLTFSLHEPHQMLEVVAVSVVDNHRALLDDQALAASPAWELVRDQLQAARGRGKEELGALEMTFATPQTAASDQVRDYARPSFPPGQPVLVGARDLTRRIHADFRYDTKATVVSTPIDEVMERRLGVCQDFAHVQIACLRSLGLPASYVSGYLVTRPPPGKQKLIGADASHAWVSVYSPGAGWVDFDPTNDLLPGDEHVTAAFGRDFADVTPLKGVILGGGAHEITVGVDVEVLG
jgi:transglutaminase-like putative cysteine protease